MRDENIKVPGGFHFAPFEEQLINVYLKPKVLGQKLPCNLVEERQIYGPDANPWQLFDPENHSWILSEITPGRFEKITYVFVNLIKKATVQDKKKGRRENYIKKAGCGTWDGQTKRTEIRDSKGDLIGERRMLSFEINEVSDLDLSKVGYWRMHEYHLCGVNQDISNPGNTVLCKITLDQSKNTPVKLRPVKGSIKPEKKNTNVYIASSPSIADSCSVNGNEGVSGNPDDEVVSGNYKGKEKEACPGTENVETRDGVECVNSSSVEEDTAVIASSPSKEVKTGFLNPSISDFHWPAKNDKDCEKIEMKGVGDLYKVQSKEEEPVEDTSTSLGKRKVRDEISDTVTKKLCP